MTFSDAGIQWLSSCDMACLSHMVCLQKDMGYVYISRNLRYLCHVKIQNIT